MRTQPANADLREIRTRAQALHDVKLTPANSRALRAETWALLADLLISDYLHRWNGAAHRELVQAEEAAERALELDPEHALAHYAMGFIERAKGRHRQALAAFERALRADPAFVRASVQKANQLINLGRPKDAAKLAEEAIARSPSDESIGTFYWVRGRAAFYAGDYKGATEWLAKSVAARPHDWYNRLFLVSAHALAGDHQNAGQVLAEFNRDFEGYSIAHVAVHGHANPNAHRVIVKGRENLHEGLRRAGMPETAGANSRRRRSA